MNVYNYDRVTGVLTGSCAADPDPLTPGQFLLPAFSTTIAPPTFDPATQQATFAAGAWTVGAIPAPPAPPAPTAAQLWAAYQAQAHLALGASDITLIRCFEKGVAIPSAWPAYRVALRAIVAAPSGDPTQPLPTKPAYPPGS